MRANSVLSGGQMDALSPEMRQIVEQGRQSAAMLNGMTHSAYQNTSQRFSALQQLINRIATAHDPKAIQDLQARIQAEQNMLTNEQTKLQSLYQVAQSEELMRKQRIREQSASDIGSMRSLPTVDY
jgi:type IV secretion system protein VirB5